MSVRVQGLVLAGGRGRRFGADKVLVAAHPRGPSMLEVALRALTPVCDALSVVRADPLPDPLEQQLDRLVDERRGPVHALALAFEQRPAERWLVAASDLPQLDTELYRRLLREIGTAPAACFAGEAGLDPLVAVFAPTAARTLIRRARVAPRISLREVLGSLRTRILQPTEDERNQLCNVNRPEDLDPQRRPTTAPEEA